MAISADIETKQVLEQTANAIWLSDNFTRFTWHNEGGIEGYKQFWIDMLDREKDEAYKVLANQKNLVLNLNNAYLVPDGKAHYILLIIRFRRHFGDRIRTKKDLE